MKKSHLILLFVLCCVLSINTSLGINQNKKEEALHFIKKGVSFWSDGQIDSAIIYLMKAERNSRLINDSAYIVACYNNLGIIYTDTGKYKESLNSFQNAYTHLSDTLSEQACKIILNIGIVYGKLGIYEKALNYYMRVLDYDTEVLSEKLRASFYNQVGIVKRMQREFIASIEYFNKSLELYKSISDKNKIAGELNNIGNSYKDLKKYKKALQYFNEALVLKKELGNKKSLGTAYNNIGDLQISLSDYKNAEKNILKSLKVKEEIKYKAGIISSCSLLGELYSIQKKYKKAEQYLLRAKGIVEEIKALNLQREVYLQLKNLYAAQNKGKQALAYYDKYIAVKDSIFNTENMQHMQEMETRYQTREKEQQIEVLNIEKEAKVQESLYMKIVLGVFLFSMLPLAFFMKQRHKTRLLQERITGENRECNRISRDLHDGVASSLSHLCRSIEKEDTEQEFAVQLRKISDEVRSISHQLNMTAIGNQKFREALSDSLPLDHFPKDIDLKIHLSEDFEIDDYKKKVYIIRIVQELINNSLKHAQASTIIIKFKKENSKLQLEYADDGIGVDLEKIRKGNGWHNIHERAEFLSGKLKIDSSEGNGFYLKLVV